MSDHLSELISSMTQALRGATARAANLCVAHGHHEVDIEHVLLAALDTRGCDLDLILERLGNVSPLVRADLESRLQVFRSGNARTPVFAGFIPSLFEEADAVAKHELMDQPIRTGHLLLGLLGRGDWRPMLARVSPHLAALDLTAVRQCMASLGIGASEHPGEGAGADARDPGSDTRPLNANGPALALERFTIDLTERARAGRLDPVVGREKETLQLITILCRRRQNNPILVGEAGVGKTAVVEGLALAIARGAVPPLLKEAEIRSLDMALLQAGASVKGEFESRLRDLLAEIQASPNPVILFVDEAHTLIGAGGVAGQNDAANLLKPALARGELRTIAATTWAEYKRHVEKDAALTRRFQPVKVDEPDQETAEDMLRVLVPTLEAHAGVRIMDDAVKAAVALSARYIADRQLPDKAIALLDSAVARVMLSRCDPHPVVTMDEAFLTRALTRVEALARDEGDGDLAPESMDEAQERVVQLARGIEDRRAAIAGEKALIEQIQSSDSHALEYVDVVASRLAATRRLAELQGDAPLVPRVVDAGVVAAVLSDWTGIPAGKMTQSETSVLNHLEARLAERVLGQEDALSQVANRVRVARSGLCDPDGPQGVFLFVGPSGVGKTETALALAEVLHGSERKLIAVNMSEYQEAHSVSSLKGAPAGYVGYGEGGTLTEAIRRQPYSVLLLDEVEKAHPDVLELFYQVFDRGYMADAEGREIDFRQTTIVLTSNVGSRAAMQACFQAEEGGWPTSGALLEVMLPFLYKAFNAAFLGRLTAVPYFPLTDDAFEAIIRGRIDKLGDRLKQRAGQDLVYDQSVVDWVMSQCREIDAGARDAIRVVDGKVAGTIARVVMGRDEKGVPGAALKLTVNGDDFLCCELGETRAMEVQCV
ncbi:type VI secretion system ATPase TssH [Luteibacter sp. 22Crub2.1]|uniref:type VI secretion system ATPase TssH n=1 Tax=Luteibacter sp. 22Crub2.1 TaxID=1283288 RepID=UPI0009A70C71|nr:type VI secretion system ATPase TssH [Luteibacter sp. 22Crub2.1]SKB46995.1 type VI secretion system protein VasG [Luteibacter sp. 22Crub2.1]